jgi:hypothetical protein
LDTCEKFVVKFIMDGGQFGMAVDSLAGGLRSLIGQVVLFADEPAVAIPSHPPLRTQGCKIIKKGFKGTFSIKKFVRYNLHARN